LRDGHGNRGGTPFCRATDHLTPYYWRVPGDIPEPPSTASDRRQQQPVNQGLGIAAL